MNHFVVSLLFRMTGENLHKRVSSESPLKTGAARLEVERFFSSWGDRRKALIVSKMPWGLEK